MDLFEVYSQLIEEVKNSLKYYENDDIDFLYEATDKRFKFLLDGQVDGQAPKANSHVNKSLDTSEEEAQQALENTIEGKPLTQTLKKAKKEPERYQGSRLLKMESIVTKCKKCPLHKTRNNTVFGEGSLEADIMFIGEGPGENEDLTGRPFVGKAGQLLVRIIENVLKLERDDVYMANIVKCRPPGNRNPNDIEIRGCIGYLHEQIKIINPKIIVPLGSVALKALLPGRTGIVRNRGMEMVLPLSKEHVYPVIPTYHPSYLLRGTQAEINKKKREVWEDIKKIMRKLDMPVS